MIYKHTEILVNHRKNGLSWEIDATGDDSIKGNHCSYKSTHVAFSFEMLNPKDKGYETEWKA